MTSPWRPLDASESRRSRDADGSGPPSRSLPSRAQLGRAADSVRVAQAGLGCGGGWQTGEAALRSSDAWASGTAGLLRDAPRVAANGTLSLSLKAGRDGFAAVTVRIVPPAECPVRGREGERERERERGGRDRDRDRETEKARESDRHRDKETKIRR